MSVKMIITDLDGTLIRSDGNISLHTKEILRRCQSRGIYVVFATARYWIGAERYIAEIMPDYEITTDGTLIHRRGEQVYSCNLEKEVTNQIVQDLLTQDPSTEITMAVGRQVFWNSEHISESKKLYKATYCDYKQPLSYMANKIVAKLADSKIAESIAKKYNCRLQTYRGEKWYAFLPKTSSKVSAIKELANRLNITLNDIVAFGDDKNDVEMLKICGIGVAVANAISEVKDVADCVTLSNDEDGVAAWIEKELIITD